MCYFQSLMAIFALCLITGCTAEDGARPTALSDGSVGYAVHARLQFWEDSRITDEQLVRTYLSHGHEDVCAGNYTVLSTKRIPPNGPYRDWVDAVVRCDK